MRKIKVKELLDVIPYSCFYGNIEEEIAGITCFSKEVEPLNVFAAIKGFKDDGLNYIEEAIEKGASCILAHKGPQNGIEKKIPWIVCQNERLSFALASSFLYPVEEKDVKLVGITGTNGKTTIVYLLRSIFKTKGNGAILSTIEYDTGKSLKEAQRTTPEAHFIHKWLYEISKQKIPYAAIEVSSHSLELNRVAGLKFDAAGFTNLTRDHLDFHINMERYYEAKKKLFFLLKEDGFAVINIDDSYGLKLSSELNERKVIKVSTSSLADCYLEEVSFSLQGISAVIKTKKGKVRIKSSLIGSYNLYNILFATAFADGLGIEIEAIEEGISSLKGVPGRLERVDEGQDFYVFVDYAHSDDALKNVLLNIKPLSEKRVITLFGCGGDRDKTKRPLMGAVAAKLSDVVILTSDNSRSEEPENIAKDVESGIMSELYPGKEYIRELDRREAIRKALHIAKKGDIVIIAGKGHERTQTAKGISIPFHDPTVAREILREIKK